uniref:Protein FAM221A n=1 Tax=Chromera velia CCMP2878 TaxID=1169474 RepID=A0A0G4FQU2_9ALVE|mmetsp:Transcript_33025/g.65450  ORF Transcript_33025/g.65450 Transcript_33025/m.65450 type:complete len:344 (+) Transcript_33025:369-1400(+)|eukprot:Cvel_18279.t1-p1 / transcript=Cvel_18279.t1 / gene=Cvel_18279 / organism=Chromera_velia_CCMP2878 / gene_product=Protein FAM221A, putative / transcript_product=Protein FAM221A, putative / location=Cvel_scaffold1506:9982-11010(-) / protein_length=343 / sequence_SO=supercontig / SO=protein_coding / is_pseudo=false
MSKKAPQAEDNAQPSAGASACTGLRRLGRGSRSGSSVSSKPPSVRSWKSSASSAAAADREKLKVSFMTYDKLVGEADGGEELPPSEMRAVLEKYKQSWNNRQVVRWISPSGSECVRVKPNCLCWCGHAYKTHEWWDVQTKKAQCRCPGCKCTRYNYLPHAGSWSLTCKCKHDATAHALSPSSDSLQECTREGCGCVCFQSSYRCRCGFLWSEHETAVQAETDRAEKGQVNDRDAVAGRIRGLYSSKGKEGTCKNALTALASEGMSLSGGDAVDGGDGDGETKTETGGSFQLTPGRTATVTTRRQPAAWSRAALAKRVLESGGCGRCVGCKNLMPCRQGKGVQL